MSMSMSPPVTFEPAVRITAAEVDDASSTFNTSRKQARSATIWSSPLQASSLNYLSISFNPTPEDAA
ncbi:hypothetical protein D9615_010661 [Tricholomella constricta]|uniref:Uncharacterized protein n=1 Tax=Tricholomella constricta TaxID=117010 RepID=A0A8H5GKM0_9AGAR|nr:hypothetical protein D9615_010661 [Tricholomella constricta]